MNRMRAGGRHVVYVMRRVTSSDHFTQIKLYQSIRTRSDLNHICGIVSPHIWPVHCFVTFN